MQVAMDPHTHTFRMIIWGDMAQNPPHSSSTSSRVWYTQANSAIAWGWERGTLYNNTGRERSCWEWSGSMYMQLVCGILWRRSDMLESKGPSRHNRIDVVGWWQYRVTGERHIPYQCDWARQWTCKDKRRRKPPTRQPPARAEAQGNFKWTRTERKKWRGPGNLRSENDADKNRQRLLNDGGWRTGSESLFVAQ